MFTHTSFTHLARSSTRSLGTPIDDVDIRRPPRRSKSAERVKREKPLAISRFLYSVVLFPLKLVLRAGQNAFTHA